MLKIVWHKAICNEILKLEDPNAASIAVNVVPILEPRIIGNALRTKVNLIISQ